MTYFHKDREGNIKKISELETGHLENIVRYIERRSLEGMEIFSNSLDPDDKWEYDAPIHIEGYAVKEKMGHQHYVSELNRRSV